MNKMKKLFLLFLIAFWIYPLSAQTRPDTQMEIVSMTVVSNSTTEKCFNMRIKYVCLSGYCDLQICKIACTASLTNSGLPNVLWKYFDQDICFDKAPQAYFSKIVCQVDDLQDGCVVVVEGGG